MQIFIFNHFLGSFRSGTIVFPSLAGRDLWEVGRGRANGRLGLKRQKTRESTGELPVKGSLVTQESLRSTGALRRTAQGEDGAHGRGSDIRVL